MAAAIPRHLLETLVNCPACSQRYNEPRVLPTCGHTVCTVCLENEWNNKSIHLCPVQICRKEICSTITNYTDLPLNQTVLDLIKSCNFHVEATGQCQVCNHLPSFVKCSHCCLFVCFECGNQHRREALTTLTNNINTLEQEYLTIDDQIDHIKDKYIQIKDKSLETIRLHYARLIDELRCAQITNEELVERQASICNSELDRIIDEHKQRCKQIYKTIQDLRITITDWSTIEEFKQLQTELTHIQDDLHDVHDGFHQRLPEMKIFQFDNHDEHETTRIFPKHGLSPSQTYNLSEMNCKQILRASIGTTRNHHHQQQQHLDDSSSTASSSTTNDPIKNSTSTNHRPSKRQVNSGIGNHYKSANILSNSNDNNTSFNEHHHRSHHRPVSNNSMSKTMSNSVADLSLSMHNQKISSTNIRLSTFQSKLDQCCLEAYKKIPLSQSFDWGILAITNTDLILLYNKDKSSLIVYDANGHENERIQWSDGDIKDLCMYHEDSIIIVGEHKQASKPIECKLYVCNLSRKQLERERIVERGLNCQRIASDEQLIFYASEKGCNKSKISIFDQELQLQVTFESGVEVRSLAVDTQCCYILGKRREREPARYFLEKRHKNGQLIRRVDLYEINVDSMNRLIIDPISHGVIVTDGGNKKIWAIGPEGEKKSIQFRPWPWNIGFSTTDTLLILHAGCLTFHAVNYHKQNLNRTKAQNIITASTEKV